MSVLFHQSVYDSCCERVLERMRDTLSSVTAVSVGSKTVQRREGLHDASRAYGLLLHASRVAETQDYQLASQQVDLHVNLD